MELMSSSQKSGGEKESKKSIPIHGGTIIITRELCAEWFADYLLRVGNGAKETDEDGTSEFRKIFVCRLQATTQLT